MAIKEYLTANATGGAHGSHHVYWVPIQVFNSLPITLWKFNRPPDKDRVEEIREYMKTSKRADGLIYLACVDNQLVCYESNHRREALKEGMPIDMAQILVDVLWDATDDMIKEEFFRLNRAVSVPDLYMGNYTGESASVVMAAVDAFCKKYPGMKSNSPRPNRPNYNRDVFTQEIVRLSTELRIPVAEVMERLERLNVEMSTRPPKKLSLSIVEKCNKHKLWLFAWGPVLQLEFPHNVG
jgi:hypothetical protein